MFNQMAGTAEVTETKKEQEKVGALYDHKKEKQKVDYFETINELFKEKVSEDLEDQKKEL